MGEYDGKMEEGGVEGERNGGKEWLDTREVGSE